MSLAANFRLRLRGGLYYAVWYDSRAKQTRKSSLHTRDRGDADKLFAAFVASASDKAPWAASLNPDPKTVEWWARRMCRRARENAKAKNRFYDLRWEDVAKLILLQRSCCAVTGYPFSFNRDKRRNPFAPSLDQIAAGQGYTLPNIRLTLVLVNTAMNAWGDDPLLDLLDFVKWKSVQPLTQEIILSAKKTT